MTVVRIPALLTLLLMLLLMMMPAERAAAQQDAPSVAPKPADTFFAGSVTEITPEKVSVSRKVSGRTENRTFRITPDTKVEGKLKVKVRVTVRYVGDDAGETAMLIVVRTSTFKK